MFGRPQLAFQVVSLIKKSCLLLLPANSPISVQKKLSSFKDLIFSSRIFFKVTNSLVDTGSRPQKVQQLQGLLKTFRRKQNSQVAFRVLV